MNPNPDFTSVLVSRSMLSHEERKELLSQYPGDSRGLLKHLRQGRIGRSELGRAWGDALGIAFIDLHKTLFQTDVVHLLPLDFAQQNEMIFIYQMGDVITAAASKPESAPLLKKVEMLTGRKVSLTFAFPEDIREAIEVQYQSISKIQSLIEHIPLKSLETRKEITLEDLRKIAGDKGIIELVQSILLLAARDRASDIHLESDELFFRVRFRVDGILQERFKLEKVLEAPIVSRLKIMANLDITEKRLPQDGRIKMQFSSHSIDFRFSSVPTIYGEKLVLRILGQIHTREVPDLAELNFSGRILAKIKRIVENPNGVFIVTGPTGSGKTTTLYSILKHLNKPDVNIMTIEDPVEYRLAGANQVQVNHEIGLDFSAGLRAFLRQDPDIILVGEIRDQESARIAAQAALTGHLVMTTMHTNGAIQSVTRLIDIGVEPFLVAPSIIGVLSQRLVRKICASCKEAYTPGVDVIESYFDWDGETPVTFYRGRGCEACNYTGYFGRIAVHELFILKDDIRRLIAQNASVLEMKKLAVASGFKTIRHDGLKKVLRGLTTIEEINKVTAVVE